MKDGRTHPTPPPGRPGPAPTGPLPRPLRPLHVGLTVTALIVALDQALKYLVFLVIQPPDFGSLELTDFMGLVAVENRGVSFGMFASGSPWAPLLLTAIAAVVVAALTFWLRHAETRMLSVSLGMLIGGAVGNALDRAIHGAVMDFIDLHWHGYHWPAFNIADAAISVGAAVMVLDALFVRKK